MRGLAGVAAIVAAVAAGGPPAVAAGSPPGRPAGVARAMLSQRAQRPASASLSQVSCPTASFCLAVGGYTGALGSGRSLAEEWNGVRWRVLPSVPGTGLTSVSCTGPGFCLAVGADAAIVWNGRGWRRSAGAAKGLAAVSCVRATFCMAVGGGTSGMQNLAQAWNGSRWRTLSTPSRGCVPYCGLTAVACVSAGQCVAVGATGNSASTADFSEGMAWNGRAWRETTTPVPGDSSSLAAVSCATATYCVAVGNWTGENPSCDCTLAARWNGSSWSRLPDPGYGTTQTGISCPSSGVCLTAGDGVVLRLDGRQWTPQAIPDFALTAVSCWTLNGCMFAGHNDRPDGAVLAVGELWGPNGAWRNLRTPSPFDLVTGMNGVSCPSAASCFAVGARIGAQDNQVVLAQHWNGRAFATWPAASPGRTLNVLTGVSCGAGTGGGCLAVGYHEGKGSIQPFAERRSGGAWRVLPAVPHRGRLTGISCTSGGRCVAVGNYLTKHGSGMAMAMAWTGSGWQPMTAAEPGATITEFDGIWCASAASCIAVGTMNTSLTSPLMPLAERWDGTRWTVLRLPAAGPGGLSAISCAGPSRCMAVGSHFNRIGHSFPTTALAESWNGTGWRVSRTPAVAGAARAYLADVSCPSRTRCLAVGAVTRRTGVVVPMTQAWAGGRWRLVPISPASPYVSDLNSISCVAASRCVAVGETGAQQALAYQWNGTAWRRLRTS